MQDYFIVLEGHQRNEQARWEQVRALAYDIALFGNSDRKKLARTAEAFWPFPWDEHEDKASKYKEIYAEHMKRKVERERFKQTINGS